MKILRCLYFLFLVSAIYASCDGRETVEEYYPNGSLKTKAEYQYGKPNRLLLTYFENGNLKTKSYWKDSIQHGRAIEYNSNGSKRMESNKKEGKWHGLHLEYDLHGNLIYQCNYRDGLKIGEEINYYKGNVRLIRRYNQEGTRVYIALYDTLGIKSKSRLEPLLGGRKDTVKLNETYPLTLEFPYPQFGKTFILVGRKKKDQSGVLDVSDTLYSADNRRFFTRLFQRKREISRSHFFSGTSLLSKTLLL